MLRISSQAGTRLLARLSIVSVSVFAAGSRQEHTATLNRILRAGPLPPSLLKHGGATKTGSTRNSKVSLQPKQSY